MLRSTIPRLVRHYLNSSDDDQSRPKEKVLRSTLPRPIRYYLSSSDDGQSRPKEKVLPSTLSRLLKMTRRTLRQLTLRRLGRPLRRFIKTLERPLDISSSLWSSRGQGCKGLFCPALSAPRPIFFLAPAIPRPLPVRTLFRVVQRGVPQLYVSTFWTVSRFASRFLGSRRVAV